MQTDAKCLAQQRCVRSRRPFAWAFKKLGLIEQLVSFDPETQTVQANVNKVSGVLIGSASASARDIEF